jgi:hypothetical protein
MSLLDKLSTGTAHTVTGAFEVDVSRGERKGDVSQQWAKRRPDERFLDLAALEQQVRAWANHSRAYDVQAEDFVIDHDGAGQLLVTYDGPGGDAEMTPFAFDSLARLAGLPPRVLTERLDPDIAALALENALSKRQQPVSCYTLHQEGARPRLRGITSPRYGRIADADVIAAVRQIAGDGTGDTAWKVPGQIDWAHGTYDPFPRITQENTTLYASDRDVFCFLVDDTHPIEIGKLPSGNPDLLFRGFYVHNSEVGAYAMKVATMYLRAVCQNRNLWGCEGFNEVYLRHNSGAPDRFLEEAAPALLSYAHQGTGLLLEGIKAARGTVIAHDDDDRIELLQRYDFGKGEAERICALHLAEEHRPIETVWDVAQGITAFARSVPFSDTRLMIEKRAGRILDKIAKAA